MGRPVPRDDFEGIAYLDGVIYLVTSAGLIYVTTEGDDGERVDFEIYRTGLGRYCEIEGLALTVAMVISMAFVYANMVIWKLEYGKVLSGTFFSMLTRRNRAEEDY